MTTPFITFSRQVRLSLKMMHASRFDFFYFIVDVQTFLMPYASAYVLECTCCFILNGHFIAQLHPQMPFIVDYIWWCQWQRKCCLIHHDFPTMRVKDQLPLPLTALPFDDDITGLDWNERLQTTDDSDLSKFVPFLSRVIDDCVSDDACTWHVCFLSWIWCNSIIHTFVAKEVWEEYRHCCQDRYTADALLQNNSNDDRR